MQLLCDPSAYITLNALVLPIQCQPLMLRRAKPISEASVSLRCSRYRCSSVCQIYQLGFSSDFFPLLRQGEWRSAPLHGWHSSCRFILLPFILENGVMLKHERWGMLRAHARTRPDKCTTDFPPPFSNTKAIPLLKSMP